jgi:hypothetical protein
MKKSSTESQQKEKENREIEANKREEYTARRS